MHRSKESKNSNTVWHHAAVTRVRRESLNDHRAVAIWFTGLFGSGKSTLAHAVEEALHQRGCRTFVLDGDNVRHGLRGDLGFSAEDRHENIRRIAEVARLMVEAGVIVLTAFISPFAPIASWRAACFLMGALLKLTPLRLWKFANHAM
jgi:adenylylsulfate kinase